MRSNVAAIAAFGSSEELVEKKGVLCLIERRSESNGSPGSLQEYVAILKGNMLFLFIEQKLEHFILLEGYRVEGSNYNALNGYCEFELVNQFGEVDYVFACLDQNVYDEWIKALSLSLIRRTRSVVEKLWIKLQQREQTIKELLLELEMLKASENVLPKTHGVMPRRVTAPVMERFIEKQLVSPPSPPVPFALDEEIPAPVLEESPLMLPEDVADGNKENLEQLNLEENLPLKGEKCADSVHKPVNIPDPQNSIELGFSCRLDNEYVDELDEKARPKSLVRSLSRSLTLGSGSLFDAQFMIQLKIRKHSSTDEFTDVWDDLKITEAEDIQNTYHAEFFSTFCTPVGIENKDSNYRIEVIHRDNSHRKEEIIAFVECSLHQLLNINQSIHKLTKKNTNKMMTMNLFHPEDGSIIGELNIAIRMISSLENVERKLGLDDCTKPVFYENTYTLPDSNHHSIRVLDRCYESFYPVMVAVSYLRFLLGSSEMPHEGEPDQEILDYYKQTLRNVINTYSNRECYLRKSSEKKNPELDWITINCCSHEFHYVNSHLKNCLTVTTFGACTSVHSSNFVAKESRGKEDLVLRFYEMKGEMINLLNDNALFFKESKELLEASMSHSEEYTKDDLQKICDGLLSFGHECVTKLQTYKSIFGKNGYKIDSNDFISDINNTIIPDMKTELGRVLKLWPKEIDDLSMCVSNLEDSLDLALRTATTDIDSYLRKMKYDSSLVIRKKLDSCMSQLLGAVATGFIGLLKSYFDSPTRLDKFHVKQSDYCFWKCLFEVGYLCSFECLLSAFGDEKNMLIDFYSTVDSLKGIRLKVHPFTSVKGHFLSSANQDLFKFSRTDKGGLLISIGIPEKFYDTIPSGKQNRFIKILPLFFTQGLNEQQVLAYWKGDAIIQHNINIKGIQLLEKYYCNFKEYVKSMVNSHDGGMSFPSELIRTLDDLLSEISTYYKRISKINRKDTTILFMTESFVRILSQLNVLSPVNDSNKNKDKNFYPTTPFCSRFTTCKSAKDRTSMSVTLEQTMSVRFPASISIQVKDLLSMVNEKQQAIQRSRSSRLSWFSYSSSFNEGGSVKGSSSDVLRSYSSSSFNSSSLQDENQDAAKVCHLHESLFKSLLICLRGEEGTRLRNAERNVFDEETLASTNVRGKFAFNSFQLSVLPELYRPPASSAGGNIQQ